MVLRLLRCTDTVILFRSDKNLFGVDNNVYLASALYLWSDSSSFKNIIDTHLFTMGVVAGGCNARTFCTPDFIINDTFASDIKSEVLLYRDILFTGELTHTAIGYSICVKQPPLEFAKSALMMNSVLEVILLL